MPRSHKRDEWERRLGRYRQSACTVAQFCQQEDVSVASFYYWKRQCDAVSPDRATPAFIPVRLESPSSGEIRIELPDALLTHRLEESRNRQSRQKARRSRRRKRRHRYG